MTQAALLRNLDKQKNRVAWNWNKTNTRNNTSFIFLYVKIRYHSVYDKKMKEIAEQGFPEIIFKKGQFCENFDF